MNPDAPTGPSQPSTSSSSFQAHFPNQSQSHLPYFSATVKFPMSSPVPFQYVIGLQPLSPCFYPFYPSSSPEGFFSQNPTGLSNLFGSNVVVDLTEDSQGVQRQNDSNILNGLKERCVFSTQELDPLTNKCPLANCVCQGPKRNHMGNGLMKTTQSSSGRNIQNCSRQTNGHVPAIEGEKNSSVQVIRSSAFQPVCKELPKKSVNEVVLDQTESNGTMLQSDDAGRMEKEPEKLRASIPKLLDIAEKDTLNEATKKAIFIRPRARGMFTVTSGKTLDKKDEEVIQFTDKLVDLKNAEDKEVDEPIKKKKKPGPKPKKRH